MKDVERRDFLEICDDLLSKAGRWYDSQVPTASTGIEQIGDPTIADRY